MAPSRGNSTYSLVRSLALGLQAGGTDVSGVEAAQLLHLACPSAPVLKQLLNGVYSGGQGVWDMVGDEGAVQGAMIIELLLTGPLLTPAGQ